MLSLSILAEQYVDSIYAMAFGICCNVHDAQNVIGRGFWNTTSRKEICLSRICVFLTSAGRHQ